MQKNERTVYKECYKHEVVVEGTIAGRRKCKEDGYENIIDNDTYQKARENKQVVSPIAFVDYRTLIKDATIDGKPIGDGHIWVVEDLKELKNMNIGDRIKIFGTIQKYTKHHGKETDYCISPYRFEKVDDN